MTQNQCQSSRRQLKDIRSTDTMRPVCTYVLHLSRTRQKIKPLLYRRLRCDVKTRTHIILYNSLLSFKYNFGPASGFSGSHFSETGECEVGRVRNISVHTTSLCTMRKRTRVRYVHTIDKTEQGQDCI